jgi:hypothetical protein
MEPRFMWIQKSPSEVTFGRWTGLLGTACLYVLLGVGLWYFLVRFFTICGVLPRASVSGWVGCAVAAVILPAAWFDNRRAQRKSKNTLVCDRCNLVKGADGQLTCKCGGHYLPLAEMKWIDPAPTGHPSRKSA